MSTTFRLAHDDDFEQIYNIWLDGIASTFADTPKPNNLKELFKANFDARQAHFNFWVAEIDGKIGGWVSLLPCSANPLKKDTVAEVSVYINRDYQKNHLATQLMAHVFEDVKSSPLKFLFGYVAATNYAIIKASAENNLIEYGRIPASDKAPKSEEKITLIHKIV